MDEEIAIDTSTSWLWLTINFVWSRWLCNQALFFGRFSAIKTKSTWENLEFLGKILEFFPKISWVFLKIPWVYSKEWKIFPKFPEFSQFQALKLKFGQTFVQNMSTSGLFWAKSQFLVGKLLSFWIICLNFSKICLSFFSAWVFLTLSFFRNVQKKSLSSDVATILATIPLQHYNYTFGIYTLLRHLFLYDDDMMF